MANLVITISRSYGSSGKAVGKALAKELGINCYDRTVFEDASDTRTIEQKILELASSESCVIVGRSANHVLKGHENLVRVFVFASHKYCVKTVMDMYGISADEADSLITRTDKARSVYYNHYTGGDRNDFRNYDLCVSTSALGIDGCVKLIKEFIDLKG